MHSETRTLLDAKAKPSGRSTSVRGSPRARRVARDLLIPLVFDYVGLDIAIGHNVDTCLLILPISGAGWVSW